MTKPRRGFGPDYSWLRQFDVDGPFLSLPVVKGFWPSGVDRLGDADDRLVTFKQGFTAWLRAYDRQTSQKGDQYADIARAWADTVLDELAGWDGLRISADELPQEFETHSPGEQVRIRADGGLRGRERSEVAALLRVVGPTEDLRGTGLDGWAATEIDRMAALLRKAGVPIGLVTDGRWWAIVWAEEGKATGSGIVDAVTWGEEPLLRDAFFALIDQQRLRAKNPVHRLSRLLQRSELEAEEITEALGTQVRRSVELLVQAFSEARLIAAENDEPDPLTERPDDVYQAAVTVMMRVVFLLFAEERGMLPTEQLYWDSYAIRGLLDDLKARALANDEEQLDESHDVWHRLLAVSDALYSGVNYDEMRMPAYGGSLLDPARFPWLTATGQHGVRVQVSDRVMLHVLQSVQEATVRGEARRISFRDIDVEQIGYIYEGLLGYTCATVTDDVLVGLVGKDGEEPEIGLSKLDQLRDSSSATKVFVVKLIEWVKKGQPAANMKSAAQMVKLADSDVDEAELRRLLTPVAGHDSELLSNLIRWGNLIRRDLRGIPLVVPPGGLAVVETPSRRNAGAHYTPRSLAEEVVKYALEPVVYEPGPLQTNDIDVWKLKSSTAILDLKVADIAAGSGAFLVAAARFLAKRVTESWTEEGMLSAAELASPLLAEQRAIREVVARCLYGADINPMAVEMSKLSMWLVSLDKSKPFSFVDDKIFCGDSLLGMTTLDQLRHLHIHPDKKRKFLQPFVDVDEVLTEATRLRRELASPVDEDDPQRSRAGKMRLLRRAEEVTAQLRLMADGIIAAGLATGGKPGPQLDDSYKSLEWALAEAFPNDGSAGNRQKLDAVLANGLTPTVDTDYQRWQPLHWVVEVPDVMERGGFDAIIGNPPFLVGKKIRAAVGSNYRSYCAATLANGRPGNTDLVAFFLLRAAVLGSRTQGQLGLITAKVIAEGDTREVGLDQLSGFGFEIRRAIRSEQWPSSLVATRYAVVWASGIAVSGAVSPILDGVPVHRISTSLEEADDDKQPIRLPENENVAFKGYEFTGNHFFVDAPTAHRLIEANARNGAVVISLINGRDLNSSPSQTGSRYALYFRNFSWAEARSYQQPFGHLRRALGMEDIEPTSGAPAWWHARRNSAVLTRKLDGLSTVICIAAVSSHAMPVRVPTDRGFTSAIVVITQNDSCTLAALSSSVHNVWTMRWGSKLRLDIRYTVTDVFETFPRPSATRRLAAAGEALDDRRRQIMLERELGLTSLYNLVHDPSVSNDPDVDDLRAAHIEIDAATAEAYGWMDVKLDHGFYTYKQKERFTVSPAVRVEILNRLLEENHRRAGVIDEEIADQQGDLFS